MANATHESAPRANPIRLRSGDPSSSCIKTVLSGRTYRSHRRGGSTVSDQIAGREAEYAAPRAIAADRYDDRVSENLFDVEDERAEVDIIVHGMIRDAN